MYRRTQSSITLTVKAVLAAIICFLSLIAFSLQADEYKFSDVALSESFACGITKHDSGVLCWGTGLDQSLLQPPAELAPRTTKYKSITVGDTHACALTTDSKVVCWGDDDTEEKIKGPNTYQGHVQSVSAGHSHTCIILSINETVVCFDDGTIDIMDIPSNVTTVSSVSSGKDYSCVIGKVQSDVFCWGTGMLLSAAPPTSTLFPNIVSLTTGDHHACALNSTGSAYCWDTHGYTSNNESIVEPMTYDGIISVISAGFDTTCLIDATTGKASCFGGVIPVPDAIHNNNMSYSLIVTSPGDYSCGISSFDNGKLVCGGGINQFKQLSVPLPSVCNGVSSIDTSVCSSNGVCNGNGTCICDSGFIDDDCSMFECFGFAANETDVVCSGNGQCTGVNACSCFDGYIGVECDNFTCQGLANDDPNACSGRGSCIDKDNCDCTNDYYGDYCQKSKPVAKIAFSNYYRSCGDITIDGSQSISLTNGTVLKYAWSSSNTSLAIFLSNQNKPIISIPASYLPSTTGKSITVSLVVSNQENVTSAIVSTTIHYTSSATSAIYANIAGPSVQSIKRSQPFSLLGSASIPTCIASVPKLTYTWSIVSGPDTPSLKNTSELSFAAGALSVGTYKFQLSVTAENIVSTTSVTIHVQSSPLVAIIQGGDRLVARNKVITLDASKSYDPDRLNLNKSYVWTCGSNNCSPSLQSVVADGTSTLVIPANMLDNSQVYTFCVAYVVGSRSSETCIELTVSNGIKTLLDMSMITTHAIVTRKPQSGSLKNSVRFSSSISDNSVTCTWKLDNVDINSSTGLSQKNTLILYTEPLVEGKTYTLRTDCSSNTVEGWAKTQFVVNEPPTSGAINVDSSVGEEFSTLFSFIASGWVDSELPLKYSWTATSVSNDEILFSTSASSQNSLSTYLPSGDIILTVSVIDNLGASSSDSVTVTVTPAAIDHSDQTAVVEMLQNVISQLHFDLNGGVSSARNLLVLSDLIMKKLSVFNTSNRRVSDTASLLDELVELVNTMYTAIGNEAVVDTSFYKQITSSIFNFASFKALSPISQNSLFSLSISLIDRSNADNVNFAEIMSSLVGSLNTLVNNDKTKLKELSTIIQKLQELVGRGIEGFGEQVFSSDALNMIVGRYYTPNIGSPAISIPTSTNTNIDLQLSANARALLSQASNSDTWFYSYTYNYADMVSADPLLLDNTENSAVKSPIINVEVVPGSHDSAPFSSFDDQTFFTMSVPMQTAANSTLRCKFFKDNEWNICSDGIRTSDSVVTCTCTHMSQFIVTEEFARPEAKKKTSNSVALGVGLGIGLGIPLLLIALLIIVVVIVVIVYFIRGRGNNYTNRKELNDIELQNVMYRDDQI